MISSKSAENKTVTMTWLRRSALCLSLLAITAISQAMDICDSTCSCLEYESDKVIVNCKSYKNHDPDIDFETMRWPKTENRSIEAFFNNMSLHLLPKVSGDSSVISINFDDNLIRTLPSNPFQYFTKLESISVANNLIADLTKDFLKSAFTLKTLNLSNNSLSNIDPSIFAASKDLQEINLSLNEFTKISADLLEALSSVEIMRFENNKIFTIDNAYGKVEYELRQMFLGFNQFTVITYSMLEKFVKLESIDLSNNKIKNIDENAFANLESLKLLDLSNNNIKRVYIRLPNSLEILTMAHNQLISWPFANTPESLAELELQFNSLEYIFPKDSKVDSLRTLDVSNNLIDHLPNTQFFKLDKLDLSNNRLTSVPQNLNSMTPLLNELILDGNQISTVFFAEKTTLGSISLNNIDSLEILGARAFSNLAGTKMAADESTNCVDIHVSRNKNLRLIDENAFEGVSLCLLDLSWNQLTKIPMNLTDWSRVQEGIDLQGNPFECNCNDQWMLVEILNRLYENDLHQFLLTDLKCQSPEEMKDLRFIQFLYHENPFCGPNTVKKLEKIVEQSSFGGLSFGSTKEDKEVRIELTHGPGFIIIIAMCVVILIAMVLVGIRWQRDQNRKLAMRNRRYDGYDY